MYNTVRTQFRNFHFLKCISRLNFCFDIFLFFRESIFKISVEMYRFPVPKVVYNVTFYQSKLITKKVFFLSNWKKEKNKKLNNILALDNRSYASLLWMSKSKSNKISFVIGINMMTKTLIVLCLQILFRFFFLITFRRYFLLFLHSQLALLQNFFVFVSMSEQTIPFRASYDSRWNLNLQRDQLVFIEYYMRTWSMNEALAYTLIWTNNRTFYFYP